MSFLEVVVTGASGFVGRAVCAELLERGVVAQAASRAGTPGIPGVRDLRVRDYGRLDPSAGAICIHLAGEARVRRSPADAEIERVSALRIAQGLAASGFAHVIFASSAQVYGDRVVEPRRETDRVDPVGAYAAAKLDTEQIFLDSGHGIARLSNVYGPGMSPETVISALLRQIPGKAPLRVHDLSAIRDFVHVRDVARGLVELALTRSRGIFNLGTGIGTSVAELAAVLARQAGQEGRSVEATMPNASRSHLVLDPTKMRDALGWEAKIRLPEGLEDLLRKRLSVRGETQE